VFSAIIRDWWDLHCAWETINADTFYILYLYGSVGIWNKYNTIQNFGTETWRKKDLYL
jgi:hypothetical protein